MTDPAHPLFGKRFQILSIARGDQQAAHVFVRYQNELVLRIPIRSTNLVKLVQRTPQARLSQDAVQEFLSLVKEYELCPKKKKSRRKKSGRRSTSSGNKKLSVNSKTSSRR